MRLVRVEEAWNDYLYWQGNDPAILARINDLVRDAWRDPFRGIGKPEPLKGDLAGWWSRRITGDHRLVYRMSGKGGTRHLEIVACRYHYR